MVASAEKGGGLTIQNDSRVNYGDFNAVFWGIRLNKPMRSKKRGGHCKGCQMRAGEIFMGGSKKEWCASKYQ